MRTKLQNSIENLYQVFAKYPLKTKIEGCPCCVGKQENSVLHSKPLRELSGKDLSFYGFKAISTFGDVGDFKHFLPRLFEILIENEFDYNEEILFRKFEYADWQNWDANEQLAIKNFFFALFGFAVNFEMENAYLTETYLVGIGCAVEDLTPYLNLWLDDISKNKIITLKNFVVDCDFGMSNAFFSDKLKQRKQIKVWLVSDKLISILENLFFEDEQFQGLTELAQILDRI